MEPITSETMKPLSAELDFSGEFEEITLIHHSDKGHLFFATRNGKRFILKAAASDSGRDLAMLKREYELSLKLAHPRIVYIYSYEPATKIGPCIVMEYVDGTTLREYLATKPCLSERRRIFSQILEATEYIHSHGIVHNDLSPENIMVCGPGKDIKIIDFGFSDNDTQLLATSLGGTRGYASPELLAGEKVDARSDIWSIGALLSDIFGGRYRAIARKCCRPEPDRRYQSIGQLRTTFKRTRLTHITACIGTGLLISALALAAGLLLLNRPTHTAAAPEPAQSPKPELLTHKDSTLAAASTQVIPSELATKDFVAPTPGPQASIDIATTVPATKSGTAAHINSNAVPIDLSATPIDTSAPPVDLSARGTANCYIVSSPGRYCFNARVKGCSESPIDGTPAQAEILWESYGTEELPKAQSIITGLSFEKGLSLEDGSILFSTASPARNGNALIAVKDSTGTILWSWHIWVCCGYDPVRTAQTFKNGAGTLMDRNIGATSCKPGDILAAGLMYQWGRKDPFLCAGSYASIDDPDSPIFRQAASSAEWPAPQQIGKDNDYQSFVRTQPMTFALYSNAIQRQFTVDGWSGEEKTGQDPCPPGWRMPYGDIWTNIFGEEPDTLAGGTKESFIGILKDDLLVNGESVWFPASGDRYHNDGKTHAASTRGLLWTGELLPRSSPKMAPKAKVLYYKQPGITEPKFTRNIYHAYGVRCMKD